jgi:hypothetical protein
MARAMKCAEQEEYNDDKQLVIINTGADVKSFDRLDESARDIQQLLFHKNVLFI